MAHENATPRPWYVEGAGNGVTVRGMGEKKMPIAEIWHNGDHPAANAALIVEAVNAYDTLRAESERLRSGVLQHEGYSCVAEHAVEQAYVLSCATAALLHEDQSILEIGEILAEYARGDLSSKEAVDLLLEDVPDGFPEPQP